MKRIVIAVIIVLALIVTAIMIRFMIANDTKQIVGNTKTASEASVTSTPNQEIKQTKSITINNEQFAYAYFVVKNPVNLSLIPNFSRPKDAQTLMEENNCVSVVNGGFYDKSNKPLGYFQYGDKILGPRLESDLFNGYVWADASGSAVISSELPNTTFNFALQTGPMLMFSGKVLPLTINSDTGARRMIAARNNKLIFLAVYEAESVYDGPKLSDLPDIVQTISTKESLNIMDAINLDGGSASAFYSEDTKLSELTPVGSLFCAK